MIVKPQCVWSHCLTLDVFIGVDARAMGGVSYREN